MDNENPHIPVVHLLIGEHSPFRPNLIIEDCQTIHPSQRPTIKDLAIILYTQPWGIRMALAKLLAEKTDISRCVFEEALENIMYENKDISYDEAYEKTYGIPLDKK